jgi:galactokinase
MCKGGTPVSDKNPRDTRTESSASGIEGEAPPGDLPEPARRALAAYRERFPSEASRPLIAAWAPGRINLIGEHTDYNDGLVLPAAVDRVVALVGQPMGGSRVEVYSEHDQEHAAFDATGEALVAEAPLGLPRWARYVRAVLAELAALAGAPRIAGFRAALAGDVPVGGGMSSSAALEVATATFAAALGGPHLPPMEKAQLCRRAEQLASGVRGGIMDQAAACLARAGHAILLDCRTLAYEYVPARLGTVQLVVFETGVSRALAETGYNERRAQCEQAVELLAQRIQGEQPERRMASARDVTQDDLARYGAALPQTLFRRLRHVLTENRRVEEAVAALRANDLVRLGQLLVASHESLRDDYAVSCVELDAAVEIALTVPGVVGARLMGAGFGGSALMLVEREALDRLARVLASEYPKFSKTPGTMHVCQVANGPVAREITGG